MSLALLGVVGAGLSLCIGRLGWEVPMRPGPMHHGYRSHAPACGLTLTTENHSLPATSLSGSINSW